MNYQRNAHCLPVPASQLRAARAGRSTGNSDDVMSSFGASLAGSRRNGGRGSGEDDAPVPFLPFLPFLSFLPFLPFPYFLSVNSAEQ